LIYVALQAEWKNSDYELDEWPSKGKIEIQNLSVRYKEGLPFVISNVSAAINPAEKVRFSYFGKITHNDNC
jgi:ABC-type bacteriocin/lantibiotic exporter with double-glycine peptidase domain